MFKIHSFFPFFNHFLSFFMLTFAAGASAIGGGDTGASVLDAVGAGDGGESTELEDGGAGEGGGEEDVTEGGADVEETGADAQRTAAAQKPGVTPEIAQALEALKTTNPKAAKEIKAKLYAGAQAEKTLFSLKKDFPGGVQDVLKLKTAIETQLGGIDGLEELGSDLKFYHDLDAKWNAKDPSLVSNLAAEYPDEFTGMVPHFISKYAELAPEAYSKMYAGMVVSEIKGQNIPQALHLLNEYLTTANELQPEQAKAFITKAAGIVSNINKWLAELNTIATTPVPDKGKTNGADKIDSRQAALDAREKQQFNREVSSDYNRYRDDLITKELDALLTTNKKTLSPERREVVIERAMKKLSAQMNSIPDFRKTVEKYEKAKDGAGLIKFLKSRCGEAMKGANGKAGIVAKAYQELFGEAALGTKKKEGEGDKGNANPGAGWVKVAKPPKASEISRRLTEAEGRKSGLDYEGMLMKNKYVLHDGKKVFHD